MTYLIIRNYQNNGKNFMYKSVLCKKLIRTSKYLKYLVFTQIHTVIIEFRPTISGMKFVSTLLWPGDGVD